MIAFLALEVNSKCCFQGFAQGIERCRIAMLDNLKGIARVGGKERRDIFRTGQSRGVEQDAPQKFDKARGLRSDELARPASCRPKGRGIRCEAEKLALCRPARMVLADETKIPVVGDESETV